MSGIRVEWIEASELPATEVLTVTSESGTAAVGGLVARVCDFCNDPLPTSGVVVRLPELKAIVTVAGQVTIMEPPWVLCEKCQMALHLNPGDGVVGLDAVRSLYGAKAEEYMKSKFPRLQGVKTEVYGTG